MVRNDSLSQIAGPLSHALRNPLGTISLHLGILDEEIRQLDKDKRRQAERSLSIVTEHVSRLHDLMQQYLLIARSWHEPRNSVDFGDYLKLVCAEMHSLLTAYGFDLQLDIASQIGDVALYEHGFRQALQHLFHYICGTLRGNTLVVRGDRSEDAVSIEMGNRGEEMTTAQLEHIFDPFHDPTRSSRGLGLYLVREVVYAHQGDLTISSNADGSTTIRITLPVLPAPATLSTQRLED